MGGNHIFLFENYNSFRINTYDKTGRDIFLKHFIIAFSLRLHSNTKLQKAKRLHVVLSLNQTIKINVSRVNIRSKAVISPS